MTVQRHTVDKHGQEVAKHVAEMLDQVGRALSALNSGNWRTFRARLEAIREHSLIADMAMNGDRYPADNTETARAIRARLASSPWPGAVAAFLAGDAIAEPDDPEEQHFEVAS